jgi:hypothetical protein
VRKIHDARDDYVNAGPGRLLGVLYLPTNEQGVWLDELKVELKLFGS